MLIDVSNYQGAINWAATDPAIDGAYIKVTEGTGFVDADWLGNHDGATGNGRPVGGYHFADLADPVVEANHFADQYLQRSWQLRPVLDIETSGASAGWIVAFRNQFRARVGSALFRVYTSRSFLTGALNPAGWIDPQTDIWAAAYGPTLGWDHPALVLWQNSDSANVPGVLGSVDSDQFMHGWTPAADAGEPDMDWNTPTPSPDWAGNMQTLFSMLNHIDQNTKEVHHAVVEPGSVTAHDPTHTPTNLADLIADTASWILAEGGQITALQGSVTAEEAHLLGAIKGLSTGAVDVNALAKALAPLLPPGVTTDQIVAAFAAHLSTPTGGTK